MHKDKKPNNKNWDASFKYELSSANKTTLIIKATPDGINSKNLLLQKVIVKA